MRNYFAEAYRAVYRTVKGPRVLFVCSGNTCRSPMAERIARGMGIDAESAGLNPMEGDLIAKNTVHVLVERGYDVEGDQQSRSIAQVPGLWRYTSIVAMTPSIASSLEYSGRITVGPDQLVQWNISDPFGGDLGRYRETADQIESNLRAGRL